MDRRPFGMVRLPQALAVLVEVGFLTDPTEAAFLETAATQDRVVAAMAAALAAFFAAR